jgi:proline racemase
LRHWKLGNIAVLHARGEVRDCHERRSRSIIGGEFVMQVRGITTVSDRPAVLPRITDQAWIYGTETLRVDTADLFPKGFALSDTWGGPAASQTRR